MSKGEGAVRIMIKFYAWYAQFISTNFIIYWTFLTKITGTLFVYLMYLTFCVHNESKGGLEMVKLKKATDITVLGLTPVITLLTLVLLTSLSFAQEDCHAHGRHG